MGIYLHGHATPPKQFDALFNITGIDLLLKMSKKKDDML